MTLIISLSDNDLAVFWRGEQSDTDARVVSAEELAATEKLLRQHTTDTRAVLQPPGLMERPSFGGAGRSISLPALSPWSPLHPRLRATAPHTLTLPGFDSGLVISRYDYLYLMAFSAEVDAAIDPSINLQFQWRDTQDALQTISKENTARIRDFYAFIWSIGPISEAALLSEFPVVGGRSTLTVSKAVTGAALTNSRIWALDANLVEGQSYKLSGGFELIDLLRVWRVQRTIQDGYWWGRNGEESFSPSIHLQPTYRYVGQGWQDWSARARESLLRIMRGGSVADSPTLNRYVQNLVNGQVGANVNAPGVATISPNGATALANEQRISFTNRAIIQATYAIAVVTTNSGGQAVATINFAGNSPSGATFAASGHKVFASDGTDLSAAGTFTGGGGTGALTWTEASSPAIAPGNTAYLVPAISYPAGSGFPVCGAIEKVFFNGTELTAANIRESDVGGYLEPAANEGHIVVMARGNAGLLWIYKKFAVVADAGGVIRIPAAARGLIAWVSGPGAPTLRQDKPVVTGLSASAAYNILCYHAPPGSEQWQFQFLAPVYAGSGEAVWLNGSRVSSHPITIAHSQGGGNSSLLGDASIQNEAISLRMPQNLSALATRPHVFDSDIRLQNEVNLGATPYQELLTRPAGGGVTGLSPGMTLTVEAGSESQSKSIAGRLLSSGVAVGALKPPLEAGTYQLIVACDCEKNGEHRLLVCAYNEGAAATSGYPRADTDSPHFAAIDTYKYY